MLWNQSCVMTISRALLTRVFLPLDASLLQLIHSVLVCSLQINLKSNFSGVNSLVDANPCVATSLCNPSDPTAGAVSGCVTTSTVCTNNNLFCTNETCQDYVGCIGVPRDCSVNGNYTNGSCDTYNCSESARSCDLITGACFDFLGGTFQKSEINLFNF